MSGTSSTDPTTSTTTGAAPGGGGSGGTSVGGSTSGTTVPASDVASIADSTTAQSSSFLNLATLPPQYSTGATGFYTRQTEAVPTSVTIGPDGALYVGELNGIPYPSGYASVYRIANTDSTTGYNGIIPSGVPQVYASGFSEIHGLAFNNATGDMYVLEYLNSAGVYDPTISPANLPPSALIQVAPDGTRTTISGPELHLGEYVTVNQKTGDVYAAINNDGTGTGEVLDYHQDATTGAWNYTVIASGLNDPRGMSIGPDGELYVLEQGDGTPSNSPGASTAPTIPFIPGAVSERFGYSGSITRVDITNPAGGQQRILTGLPSFLEYNPTTGQDRVNAIGANALTITPDGTVYIASGGGLAPATAAALGSVADDLQGILKVTGLFGSAGSQVSVTPEFNALTYAATQGPDGATTQFNTESNLYDITQGPNGELYTADAARNGVYGVSNDGSTVSSFTVLQKQPSVLTDPQYAAVVGAGGDPSEEYAAEIANTTYKGASQLPNVPGNLPSVTAANEAVGANPATFDSATAAPPTGSSDSAASSTSATMASMTTPATASGDSAMGSMPPILASMSTSTTSDTAGLLAGMLTAAGTVTVAPVGTTTSATSDTAGLLPAHGEDTLGPDVSSPTTTTGTSDSASAVPTSTTADSASSLPTLPSNIVPGSSSSSTSGPPSDTASLVPGVSASGTASALPGPVDPTSPPVLADNVYSSSFAPFFGDFAPAPSTPLVLQAGTSGGSYTASKLVVFGDRLADDGNTAALQESLGQAPGEVAAPYSPTGDFSDGPKWTTDLAQTLGLTLPSEQENFAYESATARAMGVPNPFDPDASQTPLDTFAGQIQQFEQQDGTFSPNDLVSVTFGGNDISLPSNESPTQGVTDSVNAIISGMDQLAALGAKHFLVSNLPDITLAPLFSEPAFLAATGATQAGFQALVSDFNTQLAAGLSTFQQQTGLDVKELDLNTLFNGISANPSDYGFSNISQPVLSSTPTIGSSPVYNPAIVGQNPTVEHGSLFLDPYFDPTALGQALIAQTARSTLT